MKLLCLLATAFLLVSCGARSSDEERVRQVVAEMETAAEARDASDMIEHVADDYEDSQGLDRAQLGNFLRGYFLAHPSIELIVDFGTLEFPADGIVQAEISVTSLSPGSTESARFKVEFRRNAGVWQLSRADRTQT